MSEMAKYRPHPASRPRVAFLVGCGRSGTNMITRQLDRSPGVELFNEDHPDAFVKYRLRQTKVIQRLVEQSSAQVVLFKPILDTNLSFKLLRHFPDARLLFAFRHYADVIDSSIRRFGASRWPKSVARWIGDDFAKFAAAPPPDVTKGRIQRRWHPDLNPESSIALYWLFYNGLFFDLGLDQEPRAFPVQYENVVKTPEQQFRNLSRFLSIQYTPTMIDGIFSSSVGRGRKTDLESSIAVDCEALWRRLCLASGLDTMGQNAFS